MPTNLTPREFQEEVHRGFKRLSNFRRSRVGFVRDYVGEYYDRNEGNVGENPLNLMFNAIRVMLPNLVMNFPKHSVHSNFVPAKDYAELLGLALSWHDEKTEITEVYKAAIIDAIFGIGILKTGLAESDSVYSFDEYDPIDTGEVFTESVSFDNFVVDPKSTKHLFRDARFMGDRMVVPRSTLLDSGLYNNELINRLPKVGDEDRRDKAKDISNKTVRSEQLSSMDDDVEIIELWVPQAKAIVTVPGASGVKFDEFLRVDDYYGPDEGPYTFLALSPPVPDNPMPIPMVGIWRDLHVGANKMAAKIMEQAAAQKDVMMYRPSAADDADEVANAENLDTVAVENPEAINVVSMGGQAPSNEVHLAQLQGWFNMMAANPVQQGGQGTNAGSATAARILQSNASIGLEDMKDAVYKMAAHEARKRAWYFHTDPLINIPLIKRQQLPATFYQTPMGPMMAEPPSLVDMQVALTPEARSGDWLDFTFKIEPESMARKDSDTRFMEMMDFATQILPAVMAAAQSALMLGIPFDAQTFLIKMAEARGIDWMQEVWYDPMFQARMAQTMMMGPQIGPSQGTLQQGGQANPLAAILQNGQPGQVRGQNGQTQQSPAAQAQGGQAALSQRILQTGGGTS